MGHCSGSISSQSAESIDFISKSWTEKLLYSTGSDGESCGGLQSYHL